MLDAFCTYCSAQDTRSCITKIHLQVSWCHILSLYLSNDDNMLIVYYFNWKLYIWAKLFDRRQFAVKEDSRSSYVAPATVVGPQLQARHDSLLCSSHHRTSRYVDPPWSNTVTSVIWLTTDCPSVCPSVTRVICCIKTAKRIIDILSQSNRPIIIVFRHQGLLCKSDGFTPNWGAEYTGVAIFDQYSAISRKR